MIIFHLKFIVKVLCKCYGYSISFMQLSSVCYRNMYSWVRCLINISTSMNSTLKNKRIQNLTQFQINVSASTDSTPKQVNSKFKGKISVLFCFVFYLFIELYENVDWITAKSRCDNRQCQAHLKKNAKSQSSL